MLYVTATFVFLFGLAIGSFLNVVIYRYNTGRGVAKGRSHCMTCSRTLEWYELIPVASFVIQKGRCRTCGTKLSWQYPAVELGTALLFLFTFLRFASTDITSTSLISFTAMLIGWCLLVVIVAYDIKHKIIPDGLVYSFAALGLIQTLLTVPTQPLDVFIASLLAGPILFLPFFLLWFISRGEWIGLGDGKLALGIGWMLGLGLGLSGIIMAFWIGALVSITFMMVYRLKSKSKHLTMKSEIPFAPYLILGYALAYFFMLDVIGLHTLLHF